VDILEIVVAIEHKYKVKVKDADVGRKYFTSIGGIADFITDARG
jgi:acyl carrier protein